MRKEQNDFGWDWGPAFAPAGPWLPAYAVQLGNADIYPRNTLIDVYRMGQRNNLIPDQTQPWVVNASIDYIGTLPKGASLSYVLKDSNNNHTLMHGNLSNVTVANGAISGSTTLPNGAVDLWWPSGMGPQKLYYMTINIIGAKNTSLASVDKRIGFRTIVLNELPVSPSDIALGVAPGNNWHFEINGHPFYAKGSNFIPPDTFWPRVTEQRIRSLFDSVISGRQNMLRVWSSGAYSPDFMYDLADEMGILLWSEFEFGDALYPVDPDFLDNAYEEAVYQVRRVNHHPSLAYWAGGNELENLELSIIRSSAPDQYERLLAEYEKLFLTTLFPAVFENSHSISYAPSSTSNGFVSINFTQAPYMQERYENLTKGSIYGETDYYNYNSLVSFDTAQYPVGRFSNEFGFHSMPSLPTWQQAIPNNQLHFNSTFVQLRNRHYPPGGLNITNFANTSQGMGEMTKAAQTWYPVPHKSDSVANFSSWCWTTQVFQADYYASQINFYRRGSGLPQRTLGSLYWQLEDIWQAPSWAGIEYDGVHGAGRWKVLHYRAKDAYNPVISSPFLNSTNNVLEVFVTSDLWKEVKGTANLQWFSYNGTALTAPLGLSKKAFTVGALNTTRIYSANATTELAKGKINARDAVARISITAEGPLPNANTSTTFNHTSWFHASTLRTARLVDPGLTLSHDDKAKTFTVEATKGVSAWTWLEYPAGAVVAFDDNGFWLAKGEKKVLGYEVKADTTFGTWTKHVTVQSMWNNTLS